MKHFQKILEFQKLLKEFNRVQRDCASLHEEGRFDNDVEHSYRVAMLCWMIIDEYKLKLDLEKVLRYALVHDLVEVYAGDISLYANHPKGYKEKREHASFLKLKKKFPKLKSFWKTIATYEKRSDEESKFVYIIEKLEPILVVLLSEKDHWLKRKVSLDDFMDLKGRKILPLESVAHRFTEDIFAYLRKNKKKFF